MSKHYNHVHDYENQKSSLQLYPITKLTSLREVNCRWKYEENGRSKNSINGKERKPGKACALKLGTKNEE